MISRVNIYFEDEALRKDLEAYARKHDLSFSRAVLECAQAGLSLFKKTGSLNIDLVMEKVNRLEEAKKEIEFLRRIIDASLPGKWDKGIDTSEKQPVAGEAFRTGRSSKKYRRIELEKKDKG
jgi:hypothetical protein